MPEYFNISIIARKTDTSKETLNGCLIEKFGLSEGENKAEFFEKKEVLVSYFDDENADFIEICISISEQIFHKDTFQDELNVFTSFNNICFEYSKELLFALCSYELNGYLLGDIRELTDFTDDFLSKFPLAYKRQKDQEKPFMMLNLEAQNIFIEK